MEFDTDLTYTLLCDIVESKDGNAFQAKFGSVEAVLELLHSNATTGLEGANTPTQPVTTNGTLAMNNPHAEREKKYGTNTLPAVKSKNIFQLMLMAFQDRVLILLSVAAVVSLAIGLYQDLKPTSSAVVDPEPKVHWIEGVAIIVAVMIVVLASSINDYQKEKQFRRLNAKKEDRRVKVLRDEHVTQISVFHVLVGDILLLEPGDVTCADGVLVEMSGLKIDESTATGESDLVKKGTRGDVFVISGSRVCEGVGRCLVTAVGTHSYFGKTMMALRVESEDTPLQIKLDGLAERIAKLGLSAAIIMFLALLLKYIISTVLSNGFGPAEVQESAEEIVQQVVTIFIAAVTIVVVAVPEGLPLAVTLALAYATRRLMDEGNLVRVLSACEVMGGATVICSDKTGTLTCNRMTVVHGVVSGHTFRTQEEVKRMKDDGVDLSILHQSVAINSTAFEDIGGDGKLEFIGSKTEVALLLFSRISGVEYKDVRSDAFVKIVQCWPFASERKSMATLVKIQANTDTDGADCAYRLHVKGASEIVLGMCDRVVENLQIEQLSPALFHKYTDIINEFAENALRTICLGYKDLSGKEYEAWLSGLIRKRVQQALYDETRSDGALRSDTVDLPEICDADVLGHPLALADLSKQLVCLGVVGIEDPLRDAVAESVRTCQRAGVAVKMVTGDNLTTAKSIATKCGILTEGGIAMEGAVFRKMNHTDMDAILPRLQVLARSSPLDKQILVGRLKALGECVAVTGDGSNDGPALKLADVGFAMGITGTEIAKEASAIILMDDNFGSIVKALMWGRAVSDAVKKFLQFQLTVNISAVVTAFITSIADKNESSVLTAVQLLWVNLIMDTLAALALATDPPNDQILDRLPESKNASLISLAMWKMILVQATFQIAVGLVLFFNGAVLFNLKLLDGAALRQERLVLRTVIFNTFVWLQIFNQLNCRIIDKRLNIFVDIRKNSFFIPILVGIIAAQNLLIFFGGAAFQTVPLSAGQWITCVLIGFVTLPLGAVVRLLPDSIFDWIGRGAKHVSVTPVSEESFSQSPATQILIPIEDVAVVEPNLAKERWHRAYKGVQSDLHTFKALRGDRRNEARKESMSIAASKASLNSVVVHTGESRFKGTGYDAVSVHSTGTTDGKRGSMLAASYSSAEDAQIEK